MLCYLVEYNVFTDVFSIFHKIYPGAFYFYKMSFIYVCYWWKYIYSCQILNIKMGIKLIIPILYNIKLILPGWYITYRWLYASHTCILTYAYNHQHAPHTRTYPFLSYLFCDIFIYPNVFPFLLSRCSWWGGTSQ